MADANFWYTSIPFSGGTTKRLDHNNVRQLTGGYNRSQPHTPPDLLFVHGFLF